MYTLITHCIFTDHLKMWTTSSENISIDYNFVFKQAIMKSAQILIYVQTSIKHNFYR